MPTLRPPGDLIGSPLARRSPLVLLLLLVAAASCGGGGSGEPPVEVDLAPCGFAEPAAARIVVSEDSDLFHAGLHSSIRGEVLTGPAPSFHEVAREEGGCRHLRAVVGFCDPACAPDQFCTVDDACRPYPTSAAAGVLTVSGLGDPLRLRAEDFDPGLYTGPAGLPAPLFDAGDPIGARLAGDAFPAVSLGAVGVAAMDPDLTASGLVMRSGQDAELTWTAGPDPDACVQVVLNGFNQTHGAPLADIISCEGPDTGSLIVPQALVDEFPTGETPQVTEGYDWPHSELTRYTRSAQETDQGPAELLVRSTTHFLLDHPE